MSLTKLSLAGINLTIPGQGEFGMVSSIPSGDGKIDNLFYGVKSFGGLSEKHMIVFKQEYRNQCCLQR
jgi:hypothetical protein